MKNKRAGFAPAPLHSPYPRVVRRFPVSTTYLADSLSKAPSAGRGGTPVRRPPRDRGFLNQLWIGLDRINFTIFTTGDLRARLAHLTHDGEFAIVDIAQFLTIADESALTTGLERNGIE